jgi:K+ transporter
VEDLRRQQVSAGRPVIRIPGTGVFMNRGRQTVPLAMRANVEHLRVLHQQVVIVSVEPQSVPAVADANVAVIDDLGFRGDGITHVTARFGYMQRTNIPTVLAALPPPPSRPGSTWTKRRTFCRPSSCACPPVAPATEPCSRACRDGADNCPSRQRG